MKRHNWIILKLSKKFQFTICRNCELFFKGTVKNPDEAIDKTDADCDEVLARRAARRILGIPSPPENYEP